MGPKSNHFHGAVDKTSSSFSAHGKIGNFIFISSFTITHILIKLNQFLITSCSVIAWTDRQTDTQTDADKNNV